MNKIDRINLFLSEVLNARKAKESLLTAEEVYSLLIVNGINKSSLSFDLTENGCFDYWVEKYHSDMKKNTYAFIDPEIPFFCQFKSISNEILDFEEQIKVYIPLDDEHMLLGVEKIFDFLEENNISHLSKVSNCIRFDDVVVRLGNSADAEKLANFINSDEYIQAGLIKPNPFAVEENGLAYAADKNISYNTTVAVLVALYVNDLYDKNEVGTPNLTGFRNFVLDYYNKVIVKALNGVVGRVERNRLIKDMDIQSMSLDKIYNYLRVTELLYLSMDSNFTYQDYLEHYNKNIINYYRKPELPIRSVERFESNNEIIIDDEDVKIYNLSQQSDTKNNVLLDNNSSEEIKLYGLIKNILIDMGKKIVIEREKEYSIDDISDGLVKYIENDDSKFLSYFDGLEEKLNSENFRTRVMKYMFLNDMNARDLFLDAKRQILDVALETLLDENGKDFNISVCLNHFFDTGHYDEFSPLNNSRDNMIAAVSKKDVSDILLKTLNYPSNLNLADFSNEARTSIIGQYTEIIKERKFCNKYQI